MRRRGLLAAAASAAAVLPFVSLEAAALGAEWTRRTPGCALYPIPTNAPGVSAPGGQLHIERYWPAEGKGILARWDFDLSLLDDTGIPRSFYAWQLRRSASGQLSTGSGLRMRYEPGSRLAAQATLHRRDARGRVSTQFWTAPLPEATLMVVATARASTGAPPAVELLRFDPVGRSLTLSTGEPRDFDALLIQTS